MIVTLETAQMEGAKHRAARRISEKKNVPGFRPGKAPYEVVLRSFGESVIVEEAVDLLLDEIYPKALEEAKVEPAAPGSLEKVEDLDKEPKFTFTVPLAPTVDLGDYRSIRMEYDWKEPGEEKLQEAIDELRRMYAKTEAVSRPIETGDFIMIDMKGVKAKAEEGEAAAFDRPGMPVFVRDDQKADEFPFDGFSKELVGLSSGESKSFSHKFAKDHKDEKLAGQTVKFDVTVKMVRGTTLPEMSDEFAKQVGAFENVQAMRDAIKANISVQSKNDYDDEFFSKLLEKIKEGASIKYPPQVLDHEVEHVMEDLKSRLAGQGLDMAAYLKSKEMDEAKFLTDEARPVAVKRLERSLIMDEVAKAEKIGITPELLQSTFQATLGEIQGDADFQKQMRGSKGQPPKRVLDAVAMESANRAYIQQTLTRLKEIAIGQAPELAAAEEEKEIKKPSAKKPAAKKSSGTKKAATAKKPAEGQKKPAAARKPAAKK
jgi:trigger factor